MTCSQIILAEQICNIQTLPAAKKCTLNNLLLVSYIIAACIQNMRSGQDLDLQDRNIACSQYMLDRFSPSKTDNTCSLNMRPVDILLLDRKYITCSQNMHAGQVYV